MAHSDLDEGKDFEHVHHEIHTKMYGRKGGETTNE